MLEPDPRDVPEFGPPILFPATLRVGDLFGDICHRFGNGRPMYPEQRITFFLGRCQPPRDGQTFGGTQGEIDKPDRFPLPIRFGAVDLPARYGASISLFETEQVGYTLGR